MRKEKPASSRSIRRETSKIQSLGARHNIEAGGRVKSIRGKIPKIPAEKIDVDAE